MIRAGKMGQSLMIGRTQNLRFTTLKIGRFHHRYKNDKKYEYCNDRYGFIHDQRLPDDFGRSAREQKQLNKEMSRVDKWLKMLSEGIKWFHPGAKYHEKMVERTWKVTNM